MFHPEFLYLVERVNVNEMVNPIFEPYAFAALVLISLNVIIVAPIAFSLVYLLVQFVARILTLRFVIFIVWVAAIKYMCAKLVNYIEGAAFYIQI